MVALSTRASANDPWEVIHGHILEKPLRDALQSCVGMELVTCVSRHIRQNKLGTDFLAGTGFQLSREPDTILAPDWAFISRERLGTRCLTNDFVEVSPDIVLETRSPGDTPRELASKVALWLSYGVKVILDLDPKAKVLHVHYPDRASKRLTGEDQLTLEELVPGFSLEIGSIFE